MELFSRLCISNERLSYVKLSKKFLCLGILLFFGYLCTFVPICQAWFIPLLGDLFLVGRDLQCPLVMRKVLFYMWWAWIYVFSSTCMASMEVNLSPIEVESRCEILEME